MDFLSYSWLCPTPRFIEVKIKTVKLAYSEVQRSHMHPSVTFDKGVHTSERSNREHHHRPRRCPHSLFQSAPTSQRQPLVWFLSLRIRFACSWASYEWNCTIGTHLFPAGFFRSTWFSWNHQSCTYQGFMLFSCWVVFSHIKIHWCIYLSSCWGTFGFFFSFFFSHLELLWIKLL